MPVSNWIRLVVWATLGLAMTAVPTVTQAQDELAGIWQTVGYGYVADITPETIRIYQVTAVSCVPMIVADIDYAPDAFSIEDITLSGLGNMVFNGIVMDIWLADSTAYLQHNAASVPWELHRMPARPAACASGITTSDDPEDVFEAFWHIYDEQYAFFDLHGVDWAEQYTTYRSQVTATTSSAELFALLSDMLAPLSDGHVNLLSDEGFYNPGPEPAWSSDDELTDAINTVIPSYLIDEPLMLADGTMLYAHLSDTIGYLNIFAMEIEQDDPAAILAAAMDTVLADAAQLEALVIDIRFNGGGSDLVSLAIAGYFTDTEQVGFAKQPRTGDHFAPMTTVMVTPQTDAPFTKPVIVLTSGLSASAAEIFAMVMRQLPQVTLIGEPTYGVLSDMLLAPLPNGWITTLSNEQYLDADGVLWEGQGVPPDIDVRMSLAAFQNGSDPILDAALALLAE